MDINYNIPVTLYNYQESNNPLYSLAKLKIFYVGMTPDKRLFTKEFSDELLKSLPYVPVVGYYDKEEEDFKGHHSEVQYIYGVVPESTTIEYITEDDKEYAVCDIILYTGRKDETGEIAQQIVGKSHSLELNPDDTTYTINKDANGKVQNIEFTAGSLLGLSVLGDDEKPAFTGSEFFKNKQDEFNKIIEGFNAEWEKHINEIQTQRGNENMEFDLLKAAYAFVEKSYDEKFEDLVKVLSEQYQYFYVVQIFEDYCIAAIANEETWATEYYRISYSSENDSIVTGESIRVYPRYLTEEEMNIWESTRNAENASTVEDEITGEMTVEESSSEPTNEVFEEDDNDEEQNEGESNEQEEFVEPEEDDVSEEEEEDEDDDSNEEGEEFVQTTLIDSEREELEAFRREKKFGLINSFEEDLDETYLENISKNVDNYSYEELEVILSKEFTRIAKQSNTKNNKNMTPLLYHKVNTNQTSNGVASLIDRYKDNK